MINSGYEPETTRILDKILKEGDHVIIAGAHQGYFVSYCSNIIGPDGKVYGFEPEPKNFAILSEQVKALGNVEIFNCALADRKANAKLFFNSDNDGGHALWDVAQNPNNTKSKENTQIIKTEVKTIDSLELDRLDFLLLDAEGSEHSIIRGGINTIVDCEVSYMVCEINNFAMNRSMTSQMSLRSYLSMYGFAGYVMNEAEVVDVQNNEVKAYIPGTEQEVVFNMLFSRRGKV
jgi:FkbM family methyltransferase